MGQHKINTEEPFVTIDTILEVCMEMMEHPDSFIEETAQRFLAQNPEVFAQFTRHLGESPGCTTCRVTILFALAIVTHQRDRDQTIG